MTEKTLYEYLGVSKNASDEEIKKSFRKLSMQHHPDRKGGNAQIYKEINNAYSVLSDPNKRQEYDREQSMPKGFANMGGPNNFGMHSDIFNMMFGNNMFGGMDGFGPNVRIFQNGRPVNTNNMVPSPLQIGISITLEDAFLGASKKVPVNRIVNTNGIKKQETELMEIEIPRGVMDNESIVLQKKGHVMSSVNKGDLHLIFQIKNNATFRRNNNDLYYCHKITFKESLCGFQFQFKHLDGKIYNINNQGGTIIHKDTKKVVANLGMVRNETKGNLIIEFDIDYPQMLSNDVIEKLKELL